jgi:O-antigen ligase
MGVLALHGNITAILNHSQTKTMFWLFCWFILLTGISDNPGRSFEALRIFSNQFIFVTAFIVIVNTLPRFKLVVNILSLNAIFLIIYTFFAQETFGRYQKFTILSNFMVDPNDYSLYLNMMIPWLILSVVISKNIFMKSLMVVGVILAIILSMMTYSRGGFLGLSALFGVLFLLSKRKIQFSFIVLVACLILIPLLGDSWSDLMSTSADTQSATAQTRITMWNASWKMFLDNPMGSGLDSIGAISHLYIPDGILQKHHTNWQGDVAHSFWITALAEWGVIGTALLLYIIVINYVDGFRLYFSSDPLLKTIGIVCIASLTSFLVSSSFLTVNYYPHFWYLTTMICVASSFQMINKLDKKLN